MKIRCDFKIFDKAEIDGNYVTPLGISVNCYDDCGNLYDSCEYELGFDESRIIAFADALNSSDFELKHLEYFIDDFFSP